MQLGSGPLVGTALSALGGVGASALGTGLGSLAAVETLVYANKYVILPAVEYGVSSVYGVLGEDRLRTWQEIEYARNTYFNPFFDKITSVNNTMKDYIEIFTGRDLDGDGRIGSTESQSTNDRSKQLLGQIDKGQQQDGFAKVGTRDKTKTGPVRGRATIVSDGMGTNPDMKMTIGGESIKQRGGVYKSDIRGKNATKIIANPIASTQIKPQLELPEAFKEQKE